MLARKSLRQRSRLALLTFSFLLFPMTIYFFSPVISLEGAYSGVINGSLLVFGGMFLSALFLGRLYCGWVCPAAGQQELSFVFQAKPVSRKAWWVQWAIWLPWFGALAFLAISAGGFHSVNPL